MKKKVQTAGIVAGSLATGVAAGVILFGPAITSAASPAPTAVAGATAAPSTDNDAGHPGGGPRGGFVEDVTDTSIVAKAIGISEADLITALQGGQSMAAVAKAHSVDVQTVIDALVADKDAELAAAVKAGTMTQAQADAEKADETNHITDQVNGTGFGPGRGPGGPGGPGGHGGTTEAVSDASIVAKAIGISEADLTTALQGGQSMAAVAKAHNVDVQQVIDALVADKNTELAAAVKAGTMTQAQADAEKADETTQITNQVNGTFAGH
jgi:transposase-like protein